MFVEPAIEGGTVHDHVRVQLGKAAHALRGSHQAEKPNARGTGALERRHGRRGTPARGKHGIEQEEVPLGGIAWNLEVVINRLERIVVTV